MNNVPWTRFFSALPYATITVPYSPEDDPGIRHFVWVIDVPRDRLCAVEDEVLDLALAAYGDAPLPFLIGVATPEKTSQMFGRARNAATHAQVESAPNLIAFQFSWGNRLGKGRATLEVCAASRAASKPSLTRAAPGNRGTHVARFDFQVV